MLGFIRRVSVRWRLLAALLCVSILPAFFIGLYAYNTYRASISERLNESYIQMVRQMDISLTLELERYKNVIDDVSALAAVQEMGGTDVEWQRLSAEMDTLFPDKSGYLKALRLADKDGNVLYDSGHAGLDDAGVWEHLLYLVDEASPGDSLYHEADSLVLGRKIHGFPLGQEHIGYVFAFVDDSLLERNVARGVARDGIGVTLLDPDGTVLAGDMVAPGTVLNDHRHSEEMAAAIAAGKSSFTIVFNEMPILVVFSKNDSYGSYLLATIPMAFIRETATQARLRFITIVILAAGLCIALSLLIYNSVAGPIQNIVDKCLNKDMSSADESPDEIGFLSRAIDTYTADIEHMAMLREADRRRERELELQALQYQINPHFLFNTLSSLRWVAIMNEAPLAVSDSIKSLSLLLRSVLSNSDEMITLNEELSMLEHYCAIQKLRYADCFSFETRVDADVKDCLIPRFILQPLVENAIIHGSQAGTRRIAIQVCATRATDGVLLSVSDNGGGFEPAKISADGEERFSGIGLFNVDERLKLCFSQENALSIESAPEQGTTCRVFIPGP